MFCSNICHVYLKIHLNLVALSLHQFGLCHHFWMIYFLQEKKFHSSFYFFGKQQKHKSHLKLKIHDLLQIRHLKKTYDVKISKN